MSTCTNKPRTPFHTLGILHETQRLDVLNNKSKVSKSDPKIKNIKAKKSETDVVKIYNKNVSVAKVKGMSKGDEELIKVLKQAILEVVNENNIVTLHIIIS